MSAVSTPNEAVKRPVPRYQKVEQIISERIRTGQLKPGDRLESTSELARSLNVGTSTVRQALGSMASRGLLTRRPRLGTVVCDNVNHAMSQSNAPATRAIYAVLVPDIRNPQFAGTVSGIQKALEQKRTHVSVFSIEGKPERFEAAVQCCIDDAVDAVVLTPPLFSSPSLRALADLQRVGVPVVTCWRSAGIQEWPLVQSDPYDNVYIPVKHLLDKGCRHIALVKDVTMIEYASRPAVELLMPDCDALRQLAYERALAEYDLLPNPNHLIRINHGLEVFEPGGLTGQNRVLDALTAFLNERPQIDGIACTYDIGAGLVLQAMDKLGRKVPITGSGNLRAYSWSFAASLTTMDARMDAVGARICELLQKMRAGERFPAGHVEIVRPQFVEGESTARVSK